MDPNLIDLLKNGGAIAVLAVVVFGFMKGWIVPGYLYQKLGKERDALFELALRGTEYAESAVNSAKRATEELP